MVARSSWMCHVVVCVGVLLVQFFGVVATSHFRGGLIYWKTVGPVNATNGLVPVEITQRFAWRRDYSGSLCDDDIIASGNLTGATGKLVCKSGCTSVDQYLDSVQVYCTDYSMSNNWMVGERSYVVWLPNSNVVAASFSGGDWISLAHPVSTSNAEWEVRLTFNFNATSRSTGNASPVTKMSPVVNMFHGCNYTVRIPPVDPDGDTIRCRWANASLGECSDVCMALPGAHLDEELCVVSYSATGAVGMYAVAIQIDEFASATDVQPISSVPLQFLVSVSNTSVACDARPLFVPPTEDDGTCIAIPPNTTYSGILVARSSGPDTHIVDITTQSPAGMTKSPLINGLGENERHVNVTWTPTTSQAGTNLYCFVAVENTTASSDQSCVYFAVGFYPPRLKLGSMTPTGLVARDHSTWRVEFDQATTRPSKSAYIRFHDQHGNEILSVDSATDPSVVFTASSSSSSSVLSFETRYLFDENASYYITFDDGVAVGRQSCGPRSTGVKLSDFWVIRTGASDVTDPVLQLPLLAIHLTSTCREHEEQRPVSCAFDGQRGSVCLIKSRDVSLTVNCVESVSLTHITPGFHTLSVASDDPHTSLRLDAKHVVRPLTESTDMTSGWAEWSAWSRCSRSCDAGLQQRVRRCRNGCGSCNGDSTDLRFCNVFHCSSGNHAVPNAQLFFLYRSANILSMIYVRGILINK